MIRLLLLGAAGVVLSGSVALAGSVKLSDTQLDALSGGQAMSSGATNPGGVIPSTPPTPTGGGVVQPPALPPTGGGTSQSAPPPTGNNLRADVRTFVVDLHNHASFSVLQGDLHSIRTDFRSFRH